jgi:electron transfer flavoprotein beta subunit
MKVAVCVKEVLDTRLPLEVSPDGREIRQRAPDPVMLINPPDRAALEVALRLSPRVEAFSVCGEGQEGALRFALARGAAAAERLAPRPDVAGPPGTALVLAERLRGYDLVLCGDQTLDHGSSMVGPLVAELLGLPQVTAVSAVEAVRAGTLRLERKLDRGARDVLEVDLPVLLAVTEDAAEPRYVSSRRLREVSRLPIPARASPDAAAPALPRWEAGGTRGPARARVKKKFVPDAKASAADRMRMIMTGGASAPKPAAESSVVEGDPESLSEQMFRFLKHHGFLG